MTLKSSKSTYNFKDYEINWELIHNRLEEIALTYSKLLTNILTGLLSYIPDNRPDFLQLDLILKPYEKRIENK